MSSLLFAPMVALADEGLVPGQSATVQTGGGDASLRSAPSFDAQVVSTVSDGTPVSILEGPVAGVDGSLWYSASANGLTGYIPVDLVTGATDSTSPETPESIDDPAAESESPDIAETESADIAAPSRPWQEPIDTGVVVDNDDDPLPADGLACRVDARADAEVVVRLSLGGSLEVTGEELWAEGVAFLPVNCAGVGGFVRADYVQLASEAAVAEEAEEVVAEEIVTEEAATEEVVAEEVVTEEVAPEEPVTDVVVTEEIATDEPVEAVATDEPSAEEIAPDEVVTDEIATDEPVETIATEEVEATEEQAEDAVTEEVATEEPATEEVATEEVATEAPATDAAVTEEAVTDEVATEAVEAEGTPAMEAPAQEAATEEVSAEEGATEEIATEAAVTEEAASEERATEAIVAEATPTEQVTVTEEPTEEGAVEGRATEAVTPEATATEQAPADEATSSAPAPATETSTVSDAASESTTAAATAPEPNQRAASEQQARNRVDLAPSIGTAEVVGTNGDGVRCRTSGSPDAATITILAEGTTVQILSVERNGYLGVICGGQAGFANVEFLYSGGAGDEIAASAGSVTVVGSGGGLNCRAGAGTSYGVLTVLRDGTTLSIRGASSNGWAPVVCGGQNGYVSIDYVEASGTAPSNGGTGGDGSVSAAATTMVVRGTNGDGVRCRTGASTSASIITVLAEGTRVTTRGSAMGGWVPVVCGGTSGYVSATYLGASSGSTTGGTGTGVSSGWVTVTGTGGGGLRCRATASTSGAILMIVGEGRSMLVRGAASNGWQPVNCGGRNGFVSTQYITRAGGSGSAPAPAPSPTPTPPATTSGMARGDHAKVTDRLNLRYSASMGAGISTTIPAGTVVLITGGVTNNFYPIDWDGLKGFVSKDYVLKTTAALSERGGSGSPTAPTTPPTGTNGGTATGNAMVNFALRYEGYPYIWASHGPSGFDCSGFTYWVTKNVTGKDIGYGLWTQVSAGTPVSRANLQPGDLIFFQNTYKAGLSHSGIYIGNNRFIHAENETTGVRISDLNSTYYGSRWYGAVRMT